MADLFSEHHKTAAVSAPGDSSVPLPCGDAEPSERCADIDGQPADIVAFIELFFFAYRDFVRDPDDILEEFGFGRAHHRVLHFVCRHPGIRVARLLDVLNITKQSLARVLRQLIEDGYIVQQTGMNDRRERRLFLTDCGADLYERLAAPQRARLTEALAAAGTGDKIPGSKNEAIGRFLLAMITEPDRAAIQTLISTGADVGPKNLEAA